MTKTKLVWRLGKLPSVDELRGLVADKVITQDEARDILFSSEKAEERDKKSLESEIKFLRELVDRLSNSQTIKLVETIREVEKPYYRYDWYKPYVVWCGNGSTTTATYTNDLMPASAFTCTASDSSCGFTSIKTF